MLLLGLVIVSTAMLFVVGNDALLNARSQSHTESGELLVQEVDAKFGSTSVSSDLVTVSGRHRATSIWYPLNRTGSDTAGSATHVTVDATSRNEAAWSRYLERSDGWRDDDGDGTYVCETERVYVRLVEVDLRLI